MVQAGEPEENIALVVQHYKSPTLAERIRTKHPGAYDDISDRQLEAAIRARYPGTYDDLPSTPAASSEPAQPEGSTVGRFASGLWETVNPVAMIKGLVNAVTPEALGGRGLINTADDLLSAQVELGRQAIHMARQGRYSEALGHGGAALLPVLGPAAAHAGEQIGQGDIAGGLGKATGLVGGVLAPAAIAKARGAQVPGLAVRLTPETQAAIALAERSGVPLDAATATGNSFVGAAQHMADRSAGGSVIAARVGQQQAQGLASLGDQLATKGYASPVTAERAGEAVQSAIKGNIAKQRGAANKAYGKLREIEARPENARTIAVEPLAGTPAAAQGRLAPAAAGRFAKSGASTEELFQGVLGDARRNGFKGSAEDLKIEFADRLRSARELGSDLASTEAETGPRALLADIRKHGGLSTKLADQTDLKNVSGAFRSKSGFSQGGGSSVFRDKGLGLDDMLDRLKSDPKWRGMMADWSDHDLSEALNDIARQGPAALGGAADYEHLLRATGVEPGAKWWEGSSAAKSEQIALPVDLRPAKEALSPMYRELKAEHDITPFIGGSGKGKAMVALERLMSGPDHAPLSTVDAALSDLKRLARPDAMGMRTPGQGAAAQVVRQLDDWVKVTAEGAGPEAIGALESGRQATIAKYAAADVLKSLYKGDKPVKAYGKLTAAGDSNLETLRAVAKQAPGELPKVGRAVLDGLLERATAGGGFEHGAAIAAKWEKMGAETKRLLYKDPAYIADLDSFFRLAKMTAKSANPSGTAHALAAAHGGATVVGALTGTVSPLAAAASIAGPAAVSKLLHSAAGVRLLSKGFRIPLGNRAAVAAYGAELAGLAEATSPNGSQSQIPAPAR